MRHLSCCIIVFGFSFFALQAQSTASFKNNNTFNNQVAILMHHPERFPTRVPLLVQGDLNTIMLMTRELGATYKFASGDIASIEMDVADIPKLLASGKIKRIEYYPGKGMMMNDKMLLNNHVKEVHQGSGTLPRPFLGDSVIIGFLDTGIDIDHPDFKNPDGSSRILYIWDQFSPLGPNTPVQYGYGQEWSKNDIDQGNCTHIDPWWKNSHGSDVAGTAAGNGSAVNNYAGVAPHAGIIMVAIDEGENFLTRVADAVDYIFKKASLLGKPCVINTSVGTYFGSHDGLDLTSKIIDNELEQANGRAVVAAAGNGGRFPYHLSYPLSSDTSFTWFDYNPQLNAVYYQVWANEADFNHAQFSIGVDDPTDFKHRGETKFYNLIDDLHMNDSTSGFIKDSIYYYQNRLGLIEIYVEKSYGRYGIDVVIHPDSTAYYWSFRASGSGQFDIWSAATVTHTSNMIVAGLPSSSTLPSMEFYQFPDYKKNIVSSWQCSDHVLTVGNYVNRSSYIDYNGNIQIISEPVQNLAASSSHGPTRDGRLKPDVCASGSGTISTGAHNYMSILIQADPTKVAQGGMHRINGGTSLASPVAAGIAALFFQLHPEANYAMMIDAMKKSCFQDAFTGTNLPNNVWGYGKVNAYNIMTATLGCTNPAAANFNPLASIDDGSCLYLTGIGSYNKNKVKIYPNPVKDILFISINKPSESIYNAEITNLQGKIVIPSNTLNKHTINTIELSHLPSGTYFLHLYEGKLLIQSRAVLHL